MKKKEGLLFDLENDNKHKIFVDENEDLQDFDLAKRLNTHKDLLDRKENRMTIDQLANVNNNGIGQVEDIMQKESLDRKKLKKYKLLKQYIDREKEIREVLNTLELQKEVMKKGSKKRSKPMRVK